MISLNGVQKLAPAVISFYTGKYEKLFPSIKESYHLELVSFFTTSLNGVQKLAPTAISFYTGKYEKLFPSIKESYRLELDSFFTTSLNGSLLPLSHTVPLLHCFGKDRDIKVFT
jgi:hypothetical protein